MHTGDGLHHAAVAMAEAATIGGFHQPCIGIAVLRERDTGVAFDHAGHTGCPQDFVV